MRFTNEEIELALELKQLGLPWEPTAGHYVWDEDNLIDRPSPFHDRVFFILDLRHFLRRAESVEKLKKAVCWLPTWHDMRDIAQSLGISEDEIWKTLNERGAIEQGTERLVFYETLRDCIGSA